MSLPPEIIFHRYFHDHPSPKVRDHYWGKYDLSGTHLTDFERLLLAVQVALNEALDQADKAVVHHVPCPPFHVELPYSCQPLALFAPHRQTRRAIHPEDTFVDPLTVALQQHVQPPIAKRGFSRRNSSSKLKPR